LYIDIIIIKTTGSRCKTCTLALDLCYSRHYMDCKSTLVWIKLS